MKLKDLLISGNYDIKMNDLIDNLQELGQTGSIECNGNKYTLASEPQGTLNDLADMQVSCI